MVQTQVMNFCEKDVSDLQRMIGHKLSHVMTWNWEAFLSREDLAQEVFLRIWPKLGQYDPSRSRLLSFASRIVDTTIRDIWRENHATGCRIGNVEDEQAVDSTASDLSIDVQLEIERLPSDLTQLAESLKCSTVSEIAQNAGLHRGTVYRKVEELRKQWKHSPLHHYVSDSKSNPDSARQSAIETRKYK